MSDSLKKLGFDPSLLVETDSSIPESCVPVRVTQVQKESYFVTDGSGEVYAEVTGRLLYSADSALELPVTGDWVMAQIMDRSLAIIHQVLPRKTMLKRKTPGKKIEFQAIASSIDTALLVQALDDDFSLRRLERYLVMTREGGIRPLVLLSKSDLISEVEVETHFEEVKKIAGDAEVIAFSNETGKGLDEIKTMIKPGETYCLLGSSGVGKSTLLNRVAGVDLMETQDIRESDSKGRHTTTARQLIVLESGAMIIDTPGMRELGSIGVGAGISETFEEIHELEAQCRFTDCTHQHEDGCAVLEAVDDGEIDEDRFASYRKMLKESAYNEASFLEKKKKAKSLGKLYKSVQSRNRKR
jgi:ribosome biogenesis GTPase